MTLHRMSLSALRCRDDSRDLLPCPVYARHCVLAAGRDGVPAGARTSFLDETFLSDRVTTLRAYLAGAGAHVMASEPPEHLKHRYGG